MCPVLGMSSNLSSVQYFGGPFSVHIYAPFKYLFSSSYSRLLSRHPPPLFHFSPRKLHKNSLGILPFNLSLPVYRPHLSTITPRKFPSRPFLTRPLTGRYTQEHPRYIVQVQAQQSDFLMRWLVRSFVSNRISIGIYEPSSPSHRSYFSRRTLSR